MAGTLAEGRLVFEPIPPPRLQQIRAAGVDEAGNRLTVQVDTEGGNPLRCCLRESVPAERVLLIAYTRRAPVAPTPNAGRSSSMLSLAAVTSPQTGTRPP